MISRSCISGAATNVIYGLSYGYGFNVFIVGSVAGLGYCCAYWLGGFGVGLMGVGFLALLPVYMNISNFYSYVDNASYISYVTKHDENTINSLI
jgi:Na+/H+-translocating membrane pyrophosphatase